MPHAVYLLTNFDNSVMYLGRCEDLAKRIEQHKLKLADGFTKKYNVTKLVYYEFHDNKEEAAKREWKLKKWKRAWKDDLVRPMNPEWEDLYDDLIKLIV